MSEEVEKRSEQGDPQGETRTETELILAVVLGSFSCWWESLVLGDFRPLKARPGRNLGTISVGEGL